jgi:hypothetical protein
MSLDESTESAPIEELTRENESLRRPLEKTNSGIERLCFERIVGLQRWSASMELDRCPSADRRGLPFRFEIVA